MPPPPPRIPAGDSVLLIRTNFTDNHAWLSIMRAATAENDEGFSANLTVLDDASWSGLSAQDVFTAHVGDTVRCIAFIVDEATIHDTVQRAILCVNLGGGGGKGKKLRTMRVIPSELWSVENNLSLGNMEWRDFSTALDERGVFTGF